ncbi:RNA polymerase sigma factor [Pelotomaculum terephthalicicum JT]|uniref:RNA polymerase sigma factor n=1 Tax=Pelotomaculum TaxID=191373 RepID=UPI0009CBE9C5|nr:MULTISPECIES: RNA polymerase sigma factor [Pelotomaculum]MCG9969529.1 RNA polymerase sigma factor [Pelotomaculum terephthalicicum JT]OPX86117.1 MAG: ECF RNA polymerase sigma factor SigW [Pelotomaculum sp. PtaB.Bin117]OPY59620.1 MAG: ECF RNA polymerase sigma factor SigW [Pelotomaculum sp. PtaU1.Bin065]
MKVETIVEKLKNGDIQSLRFVYELFYKPVFRAAYFILNDTKLAEDCVHEVFLKLHSKIEQLEEPSKLENWMCRMASNIAWDMIRDRTKNMLSAKAKWSNEANPSNLPEDILLESEEKEVIKQYIQQLRPDHKRVIYFKYYLNMSDYEISTALGIPVGTVKSRLFYARKEIKKKLGIEAQLNQNLVDL